MRGLSKRFDETKNKAILVLNISYNRSRRTLNWAAESFIETFRARLGAATGRMKSTRKLSRYAAYRSRQPSFRRNGGSGFSPFTIGADHRDPCAGDGSAAIAISMHLSATRGLAALYHRSEPGSAPHTRAKQVLEAVARREMLICSTTTERGTDNLHPLTEATACEEGWRLNGTKNVVTMSPLATHVATNVRMRNEEG